MRALALVMLLAACHAAPAGGAPADDAPPIDAPVGAPGDAPAGGGVTNVFDPAVPNVSIEIDYETGQSPYTGPIAGFGDTFDPTFANLDRIFSGTKTLTIPRTLGAMQDIGMVNDEQLTIADILAIAAAHRDQHDSALTKTYYLVFVSGQYVDANGPNPSILGVSIGGTGVIAMFKDAIRSTNVIGFPNVVRYVEQSTIIHEVGHAIGLVHNGVPMVTAHEDTAHPAHCDNDKCVMYWLNEGTSDATTFATTYLLTKNSILFDAHCLADADAKTGGPH